MRREYVVERLFMLALVVLGVLTITFVISRIIPTHPEVLWAGPKPTKENVQAARQTLHLDDPLYVQFWIYLANFVRGDWGVSWSSRHSITEDLGIAFPATLELLLFTFAIAIVVGIPLGVVSATTRSKIIDYGIKVGTIAGASLPWFWWGLVLQLVFARWLGLFPAGGRLNEALAIATNFKPVTGFYLLDSLAERNLPVFFNALSCIILPSLALATYPVSLTARMTRAMMTEVLQSGYITSFNAWGVPATLVRYKYALKNALAPVVASLGLTFGYLIVNSFMIELIFAWQGVGYYAATALLRLDFPAVIACVMIVALSYCLINMVVDIIHSLIDPRITL